MTVVAVLGMLMLVSLPWGLAGEGESIAQKVRDAKTPADHQAIAAVFAKEAQAAQQEAKRHTQLKDAYAATPDMQMMVAHCEMLVKHYQEIAKDLETMAEMHKNRHCQLVERLVQLPAGMRYLRHEPASYQPLQEPPLPGRDHQPWRLVVLPLLIMSPENWTTQ